MKIALCMSGQYRTLEQCYPSLQKFVMRDYDVDLFAHFAPTIELNEGFLRAHFADYRIEPDKIFEEYNYLDRMPCHKVSIQQNLSQMDSIYQSNELRRQYEIEHGFKYDWVFRVRPDALFLSSLENLSTLSKKYCYVPNFANSPKIPALYGRVINRFARSQSEALHVLVRLMNSSGLFVSINDQFAFGSGEIMDRYAERILHIKSYFDNGMVFHAETSLYWHLRYCKVPIRRTRITYDLLRMNGWRVKARYN